MFNYQRVVGGSRHLVTLCNHPRELSMFGSCMKFPPVGFSRDFRNGLFFSQWHSGIFWDNLFWETGSCERREMCLSMNWSVYHFEKKKGNHVFLPSNVLVFPAISFRNHFWDWSIGILRLTNSRPAIPFLEIHLQVANFQIRNPGGEEIPNPKPHWW